MSTKPSPTPVPSSGARLSVIGQVKEASKPHNRLATAAGFILGGFVPSASFILAHYEVQPEKELWFQVPALLVLAGLVYSAKTVFDWAQIAFKHPAKALGFVVLVEGVMTFSRTPGLAYVALGLLVAINGIATGCNLALDSKASKPSRRK